MSSQKLVILPALGAKKVSENRILVTSKFMQGLREYQIYWSGKILVMMEENPNLTDNLDNVLISIEELPFQIKIIDFDLIAEYDEFRNSSVVVASQGFRQNHISRVCEQYQIPCIYVNEYSLKTRQQIVNTTTKNLANRLRRYLWEASQERRHKQAVAVADGIQCNGTPTYEAYQSINSSPLLYFDTRIREAMLTTEAEVAERIAQCLTGAPLRLLFSGRLIKIKGADHLIPVAQELKKQGVEFEMFICGDGELREAMQSQIQQSGLSDSVKMLGILDFEYELVPFAKKNIDLFVCCHRQGDPSCTYLETMSCGIPIVGYANEAFEGIVKYSRAGWCVKMNRPTLVARKIKVLDENREMIVDESIRSLDFSKGHTFEKTFKKRVQHIKEIAASASGRFK